VAAIGRALMARAWTLRIFSRIPCLAIRGVVASRARSGMCKFFLPDKLNDERYQHFCCFIFSRLFFDVPPNDKHLNTRMI